MVHSLRYFFSFFADAETFNSIVKRKALPQLCQKIPYAVDLLKRVWETQKSLTQLSFYPSGGQSKLVLQPWMDHCELPEIDSWGNLTPDQQNARTLLFHKGPKVKRSRTVPAPSRDNSVLMYDKDKTAKKPNDKKKAKGPVTKVDKTRREPADGKVRKKQKVDFSDFIDYSGNELADIDSATENSQPKVMVKRGIKKKLSPQKRAIRHEAEKRRMQIIMRRKI